MTGTLTRRSRRLPATVLLANFALLAGLVAAPAATAAPRTWYVALSGSGGGSCASPDYNDIQAAVNAAARGDTIHVCAGTYAPSARIQIKTDLAFVGDGADTTILDGGSAHGILRATSVTVSIDGLTLRNGRDISYDAGGAISSEGNVTILNSVITGNTGVKTIVAFGGIVSVFDSTFSGNSTTDSGGAISAANVSVVRSTFSANSTSMYGGAIVGICGLGCTTSVTVIDSTFSGNSADWRGGAIANADQVTIRGSTFSGNSATADANATGGAIDAFAVTATNSTFSGNSARVSGGAVNATGAVTATNSTFVGDTASHGGAIYAATASVTNSVVALAGAGSSCLANPLTDGGGNITTDAQCGSTQPTSKVVSFGDLALGSLAANGGPTQTIALGAGSAAIDAGIDAVCSAIPVSGKDQRGTARPQGTHCDSGAYEAPAGAGGPPAPPPPTGANTLYVAPTGSGGGSCAQPDFNTIQAAVAAAPSGGTIRICAGTYTLSSAITIKKDLSFVGDGAATTIIHGDGVHQLLSAWGQSITIRRLTLRNSGGAVKADAVTVSESTFTGNLADAGGAISGLKVTVADSTFSGNTAAESEARSTARAWMSRGAPSSETRVVRRSPPRPSSSRTARSRGTRQPAAPVRSSAPPSPP